MNKEYEKEAAERWGHTDAYQESRKKHAEYTKEQEKQIAEEAGMIFSEFAKMKDKNPSDEQVQKLVKRWQDYITKYHYTCEKQILSCLGKMYTEDERFKTSLDSYGAGTADFISKAIEYYCR